MSFNLPHSLIGTLLVHPAARGRLGDLLDAGASGERGALITEGSAWVWDALRLNGRRQFWDICALVPHVAGYVREATDYGLIGAGWRRVRRISPLSWGRLCMQGFGHIGGILRRDFPTLLTMLLEMEMAAFRRVTPRIVFLHPQITDLLLAMDHGLALERAVGRIRRGFRSEPGLATNNLGTLLPRLQEWGFEVPYLLAPLHPCGYGMRPSRDLCEQNLRTFKRQLIASSDTGFDAGVATYWQNQGVASALYDVPEPNLVEWKEWTTWRGGDRRLASETRTQQPELDPELLFAQDGWK
jgi:hypothetical protein